MRFQIPRCDGMESAMRPKDRLSSLLHRRYKIGGMRLNYRVKLSDEVVQQKIDDEMVLLSRDTGNYYGLNDVATRLWELLMESGSLDEAFEKILAEYEVEPSQLRQDIDRIVTELESKRLIRFE